MCATSLVRALGNAATTPKQAPIDCLLPGGNSIHLEMNGNVMDGKMTLPEGVIVADRAEAQLCEHPARREQRIRASEQSLLARRAQAYSQRVVRAKWARCSMQEAAPKGAASLISAIGYAHGGRRLLCRVSIHGTRG